jgi:leader peptidase (prepilin peptidase)/N-methyltransferase
VLVVAVAGAAVLGALAGVLAVRPAYRLAVPAGAPDRTACASCGTPVTRVGFRRCARCGARLGTRTWVMGLSGGVSFAALTWALWPGPVLAAALAVAGAGLVLVPVDLAVLRLPDRLVGAAFVTAAVVLVVAAIGTGAYGTLLRAALASAALAGGYLLLALLPGGPLGLGDVKLAAVLGLVLGWLGWGYVLAGAALPHLVNGPVVLVLLASGRVRRGTALPFGPALLVGALLAVVVVRLL